MKLKLEIDLGDLIQTAGIRVDRALQVLFGLDTTGSMYSILHKARQRECSLVDTVFTRPNTTVAFGGCGDYEDERDPSKYATRFMPFTPKKAQAKKFIRELPSTCGYDFAECYERFFWEGLDLDWSDDADKLFVMFADAIPHPPSYRLNVKNYDWKAAAREYKKRGIKVIAVQCLDWHESRSFYPEFAKLTGGVHVRMNRFDDVEAAVLAAMAYSTDKELLKLVEVAVKSRFGGRLSYDLSDMFADLSGRKRARRKSADELLEPIDSARFQEYEVGDDELSLKEFVAEMNLDAEFDNGKGGFKTGLIYNCVDEAMRGKAELRAKHEVVLHHLPTGTWYAGDAAREKLDCPKGSSKRLQPHPLGHDWEVWKQSTSSNRKMKPHTRVLVDLKNVMTAV